MSSLRDYRTDAELAIAAARAAGTGIMRAFGTEMEVTLKSPDQPLTAADLAADRLLTDMLRSTRPGYGWLSEETVDNAARLQCAHVWVVDPIDGTRSFIAKRPEFSISIALAERGAPVVGVVHNPATGEMYWSMRGGGAWQRTDAGDVRISVRRAFALSESYDAAADTGARPVLVASRSEIRNSAFEAYRDIFDVTGMGSTAYKMALVLPAGRTRS